MRSSIGIPYARVKRVGKSLVRVCPRCGAEIYEEHDSVGEMTTNNYAAHWEKAHAQEEDD